MVYQDFAFEKEFRPEASLGNYTPFESSVRGEHCGHPNTILILPRA